MPAAISIGDPLILIKGADTSHFPIFQDIKGREKESFLVNTIEIFPCFTVLLCFSLTHSFAFSFHPFPSCVYFLGGKKLFD